MYNYYAIMKIRAWNKIFVPDLEIQRLFKNKMDKIMVPIRINNRNLAPRCRFFWHSVSAILNQKY
jgi:hypothetical protein